MPTRLGANGPIRTCAGCRARRPQEELLRVVRGPEGTVELDAAGPGNATERSARSPGRGAYLCADASCAERARSRGALRRALRHDGALPPKLWEELGARIASVTPSRDHEKERDG